MYINGCDNGRDNEGEGEGEGEGGEGVSVDVEVSMLAEGIQPRKHIYGLSYGGGNVGLGVWESVGGWR